MANWQEKPTLQALENDKIHLLMTAGDNVSHLISEGEKGPKDYIRPYEKLIATYPS